MGEEKNTDYKIDLAVNNINEAEKIKNLKRLKKSPDNHFKKETYGR